MLIASLFSKVVTRTLWMSSILGNWRSYLEIGDHISECIKLTLFLAFQLRRHDLRSLFLPAMHAISSVSFMWVGMMCMGGTGVGTYVYDGDVRGMRSVADLVIQNVTVFEKKLHQDMSHCGNISFAPIRVPALWEPSGVYRTTSSTGYSAAW